MNENQPKMLDALFVEPGKRPVSIQIEDTLEALQQAVGGLIEVWSLSPNEDEAVIILNEEGKMLGLPLNRTLYDWQGNPFDVIAGSFLVVREGEESFESLTAEMKQKYFEMFKMPEGFFSGGAKVTEYYDIDNGTEV